MKNFTLKPNLFELAYGETISDHLTELDDGNTLLVAPTGSGKTTFVVRKLMRNTTLQVIFLCPLVSQVKQLESSLEDLPDVNFFYGQTSEKKYSRLKSGHAVMTYDKLNNAWSFIGKNTILVIDEVHKLYSAGSYRDKAIQPILQAIHDGAFSKVLMISATITDYLLNQTRIDFQHFYKFKHKEDVTRNIKVSNHPESISAIKKIFDLAVEKKNKADNRIVIVRLNDIALAKNLQNMLNKHNIKVLLCNRDEIANKKLDDLIKSQSISTDYDLMISTAVLDEAINLNNQDSDIHSIHFIGKEAHPEEIVQFIGRLRKANPPIFIHTINMKRSRLTDLQIKRNHEKKVNDIHDKVALIELTLVQVKRLFLAQKFKGLFNQEIDEIKLAKALNLFTKSIFQLDVFWTHGRELKLHISSLAAFCFKQDTLNTYSDSGYLKFKLGLLIDDFTFTLHDVKEVSYEAFKQQLKESEEDLKNCRKNVADKVLYKFVNNANLLHFPDYRRACQLFEVKEYPIIDFSGSDSFDQKKVFLDFIQLGKVLSNIFDSHDVIVGDLVKVILSKGYQYENDVILKTLINALHSYLEKKDRKMAFDATLIENMMNKWIADLARHELVAPIFQSGKHKYFEMFEGKLRFIRSKSVQYLNEYMFVEVLNAKKSFDKKKIIIKGFSFRGYHFNSVLQSKKTRFQKIEGTTYDGRTLSAVPNPKESEIKTVR